MTQPAVMMTKDPQERLDYDVLFEDWLVEGDVIASAVVEVAGSEAVADQVDVAETAVKVWLSGGIAGETARVTVRATTVEGRVKEYSFRLKLRET